MGDDGQQSLTDRLSAENERLRYRIVELEDQIAFMTRHTTLAAGLQGETLIRRLTGGVITKKNAEFDILSRSQERIEVKLSKLTYNAAGSETKRWGWGKVFGEYGGKVYDFLILVGESDPRYKDFYRDPVSPFVMFCLPKSDVSSIAVSMNAGRYRGIWLTSDPRAVRGPQRRALFEKFQITERELTQRFGI